jgi:16S rRNA (guanine527-N7)-methyltransferase
MGPIRDAEDFQAAFHVSRETCARLATYEDLLGQWQRAVNLVGPSTLNDIWHRHFADSAQLAALVPAPRAWVDLGSGAGFPGLVVAILLAEPLRQSTDRSVASGLGQAPGEVDGQDLPLQHSVPPGPRQGAGPVRITLIESNARKCAFLRQVVRQTALARCVSVDILSTRIETAATQASLRAPDVVSARAVAPLDKLLALAAPLFASSTVGLFMKGRDAAAELEAAEKLWNFRSELVPSRTERDARIVVIRNLERKNEGMTS